jgi:hypothetical protein
MVIVFIAGVGSMVSFVFEDTFWDIDHRETKYIHTRIVVNTDSLWKSTFLGVESFFCTLS